MLLLHNTVYSFIYYLRILQADQICYAVLCVFSYFAAGHEQKKQILEQAAKVPPITADKAVPSLSPGAVGISGSETPSGSVSPRNKSPVKKSAVKPELIKDARSSFVTGELGGAKDTSHPAATRTESLPARTDPPSSGPPRRPPPPSPQARQRLARAHSQALPPRSQDPPPQVILLYFSISIQGVWWGLG